MSVLTGSFFLLATLLTTATVSAQPIPGFGTMDRFDEQTKFATSLSYVGYDEDWFAGADITVIRFDLFGQYILPEGYGGYGMVPLNYVSIGFDGDSDSETGIGNIELGGLYLIPGDVPVVLRGGLALDTADDDTAGFGLISRLTDIPSATPGTTWLRLSASPIVRRGNAFFRADFGIDVPIAEDEGTDFDPLLRINIGGGIETGQLALIGELLSVTTTEDDADNRTLNMLGATARWLGSGQMQPHVTLQIPLDDDINDLIDWNLIVGLEYVMGATDVSALASDPPPPIR